ncbi:MAG: D-alanyl-D-alanine carboxypeptidase/D-alanyl-D-alanine-endopeptidase [Candidatus Kapabacteria bacterium]|nr:D-alanyl-D-alanine carboxypeptidase/D-alanyl-D-alanine-endopeptidase [Candidatus Kapabacteria bacterium]
MKYLLSLVFISINLFPNSVYSQNDSLKQISASSTNNSIKELVNDINSLLDNPDFSNAMIGICVQSMETGEYLYKHNEAKNLVPASNLKLFTTSTALEYLGKDFKYTTSLYLRGRILAGGEFEGNIIIRGSGDPTFCNLYQKNAIDIFDSWVAKLDTVGITSIRGNIIGDDGYFDDNYYAPGWAWEDMTSSFSAQVSGLSAFENSVEITLTPSDSVGERADFSAYPDNSYIQIVNNVRTARRYASDININRNVNSNLIELNGQIILDTSKKEKNVQKIQVAVENPCLYFLNIFRDRLKERRINFRGTLLQARDLNEKILYQSLIPFTEYESIPLSEIIKVINKQSNNLSTELLLKTIGKEISGVGSFSKGVEQVRKYISKLGISPENMSIVDGSGLSRYNLVSPKYIVALLSGIYHSANKDVFIESLAEPGKKGTLNYRLTSSRAEKFIKAKTGTMNNISNISGFVYAKNNEVLAFSIMMNNFTVPLSAAINLQDLLCMRLASFKR